MMNTTHARYEKEVVKLTSEVRVQVTTVPFELKDVTSAEWNRLRDLPSGGKQEQMNMM